MTGLAKQIGDMTAGARTWLSGAGTRVLNYHSISDVPTDPWSVTRQQFEEQMAWLATSDFRVISTDEFEAALHRGDPPARSVVITFDDGFRDFVDEAVPVLQHYGFPATMFVPTGLIDRRFGWEGAPDRPIMSVDDIEQVVAMGFGIGSHTVTHASLVHLDAAGIRRELEESRQTLREILGPRPLALAYPQGRNNPLVRRIAREAGYSTAYTVSPRPWANGDATDLFLVRRNPIMRHHGLSEFTHLVRGSFDLLRLARAGAARLTDLRALTPLAQ